MKFIMTVILALSLSILFGQKEKMPNYFSYLKKVELRNSGIFGYDPSCTKILDIYCEDANGHWGCSFSEINAHLIAIYKDNYAITYYMAPNGYSYYEIFDRKGNSLGAFGSGEFYITSAGVIYVNVGWYSHPRYKKYQMKGNNIVEEKQPFYYIGFKTKTNKTISVYKTKTGNEVLATLPANYDLEVLLEDGGEEKKYFLIKTDFGLVGWVRITDEYNCPIDGLIIHAG